MSSYDSLRILAPHPALETAGTGGELTYPSTPERKHIIIRTPSKRRVEDSNTPSTPSTSFVLSNGAPLTPQTPNFKMAPTPRQSMDKSLISSETVGLSSATTTAPLRAGKAISLTSPSPRTPTTPRGPKGKGPILCDNCEISAAIVGCIQCKSVFCDGWYLSLSFSLSLSLSLCVLVCVSLSLSLSLSLWMRFMCAVCVCVCIMYVVVECRIRPSFNKDISNYHWNYTSKRYKKVLK